MVAIVVVVVDPVVPVPAITTMSPGGTPAPMPRLPERGQATKRPRSAQHASAADSVVAPGETGSSTLHLLLSHESCDSGAASAGDGRRSSFASSAGNERLQTIDIDEVHVTEVDVDAGRVLHERTGMAVAKAPAP